jgi:hypothetical protein
LLQEPLTKKVCDKKKILDDVKITSWDKFLSFFLVLCSRHGELATLERDVCGVGLNKLLVIIYAFERDWKWIYNETRT